MPVKPLKTELHHWWPRTLAEHWADAEGLVSAIRPTGYIQRAPPGAFGGITNAHHVKFGGPFDSTFEPLFNQPDTEMADFVQWLATLETTIVAADRAMIERITPQALPADRQKQIARITASLLARSPSVRHSIRIGTEHARREIGLSDPKASKGLIAANQEGLYEAYRKRMEIGGRWALLFSDEKEFIAGDGFLHNFPTSRDGVQAGTKLVLPMLPTATIVHMQPMEHPTEPRFVTLRLARAEVARLNEIVQVYASDFLFFRDEQPELSEAFTLGQHRMYQYHGHDWLDGLLDDLSQYNLWGEGGSAGMCNRRPYSKSLAGNRWLGRFR